jgi:hypothetical protein
LLFIVAYEVHDNRRATGRFTKWTPPAGFEFKGHWVGVNGTGFALVDAASPAAILAATAAYDDVIDFNVVPVVEITEAVPVMLQSMAWADSAD